MWFSRCFISLWNFVDHPESKQIILCVRERSAEQNISTNFKVKKVRVYWRKLHNEEPHNLYASTDVIKMLKYERKI